MKSGDIVISKCGHDKGESFLVLSLEGEYALIADGKRRTLEKPKRKKQKHLEQTSYSVNIDKYGKLLDAHIVKELKGLLR